MSKSASSPQGIVDVLDDPAAIRKKIIARGDRRRRRDPRRRGGQARRHQPAADLLARSAGEPVASLEPRYAGAGYGTFKKDLAEVVTDALAPIRERTEKLLADEAELDTLLAAGAARAADRPARPWRPSATRSASCRRATAGILPAAG